MDPHDYFSRRVAALLFWLGYPDGFQSDLSEGFTASGIEVAWQGSDDEEQARTKRENFATAEAEVLLHHVSETLLRLYLVHAARSPCPWLDLARQRDFAAFKREVADLQKRLRSGDERGSIEFVFYGNGIGPVSGKVGLPRRRADRLLADRGYDHDKYRRELRRRGVKPIIARRSTEHGSGLGKERWVVERTFAWLHNFRRLRTRYERRAELHLAFMQLGCAIVCRRALSWD